MRPTSEVFIHTKMWMAGIKYDSIFLKKNDGEKRGQLILYDTTCALRIGGTAKELPCKCTRWKCTWDCTYSTQVSKISLAEQKTSMI